MGNPIHSITPFTLLDYPEKTACILWFAGCNMRCGYCYNPGIVLGKGKISVVEVMSFLEKRAGLLDGVVFSGGECTLHPEIFVLAQAVKDAGMLVKIDTNGTRPEIIRSLAESGIVDYVALDYKAPPEKFLSVTGLSNYDAVEKSIKVLVEYHVTFEVRTTIHSQQLNNKDLVTMNQRLHDLGYKGFYYLQHFLDSGHILSPMGKSNRSAFYFPAEESPLGFKFRNQ